MKTIAALVIFYTKRSFHESRQLITIGSVTLLFCWALVWAGGGSRAAPSNSVGVQATQQVTFSPWAIAFVSNGFPSINYGGKGYVWAGYGASELGADPTTTRGLVKFDISSLPSGLTISSAALRATISGGHGTSSRNYEARTAVDPWTQSVVTWSNQPTRGSVRDTKSMSVTSGSVSWTVTDLVREWYNRTRTNDGFYLTRENDTDGSAHDRKFSNLQLVLTVTGTATSQPDLIISHIEVTQAVQDWNNSIPLVKGKSTVVRVYVNSCCTSGNVSNVEVRLEGKKSSGASLGTVGAKQPSSGLMSIPATSVDLFGLRSNETKTFNFLLPSSWYNESELKLVATVNPNRRAVESNYNNNTSELTVRFNYRPPLSFVGVIVYGATELGYTYPPVSRDHFDPHVEWMKRVYPVPAIVGYRVGGFEQLEYDAERGADGVLADLAQWRAVMAASSDPLRRDLAQITWYGLDSWSGFEPEICAYFGQCKYFGLANLPPELQATGMDTPSGQGVGEIMAHEIGHNLGRLHASDQCTGWPPTGPGNDCDVSYPFPNGCIDEYGFDTVAMKVIRPDDRSSLTGGSCKQDIMSYGHLAWVSTYTYRALYTAVANLVVPGVAAQARAAAIQPQAVLIASGLIAQNDQVRLRPFYVVRTTAPVDPGPSTGEFSLALENVSGQVLAQRFFDVGRTIRPPGGPAPVGIFWVHMPWDPASTRIVLRKGTQQLAARQVSAHAPQVTVLQPASGETWTGPQEVRWQASDEDGDALTYLVQYSTDDGESWQPVGINITRTTYGLDADRLPGSKQAMIRVVASDGVRSNHGDSGLFTVLAKVPEVRVVEPSQGQIYPNPYSITLSAMAYDVEDGPLSGSRLVWISSQDGVLGQGQELVVARLSGGLHRLTVTATDRDGNRSTDTVTIFVYEPDTAQNEGQSARGESRRAAAAASGNRTAP
ncbi:MAG: DNRLRE domain-containing protein [Acidobacteria bacterium]|nr:DNRLRE domain-containing protein [Acidobacteriota bacterium]